MKNIPYTHPHTVPDDSQVVHLVLSGHTEQFRLLVDRHAASVLQTVGRIVPLPEDSEDVAQNSFVEAYQRLAQFDASKGSFRAWLLGIACHLACEFLRESTTIPMEHMDENLSNHLTDTDIDHYLTDTSPDRIDLLEKAVTILAAKDKLILSLYYYDGLPLREVGLICGCTDSYLRSRLQWIRKKLCHIIQKLEQDENK